MQQTQEERDEPDTAENIAQRSSRSMRDSVAVYASIIGSS